VDDVDSPSYAWMCVVYSNQCLHNELHEITWLCTVM